MKSIPVMMLAFGVGENRSVEIPEDTKAENVLETVFYNGQNEVQSKPHPSVSVGDVICLDGEYHLVGRVGFNKLSLEQLEEYKRLPRRDRHFWTPVGEQL